MFTREQNVSPQRWDFYYLSPLRCSINSIYKCLCNPGTRFSIKTKNQVSQLYFPYEWYGLFFPSETFNKFVAFCSPKYITCGCALKNTTTLITIVLKLYLCVSKTTRKKISRINENNTIRVFCEHNVR